MSWLTGEYHPVEFLGALNPSPWNPALLETFVREETRFSWWGSDA
jgi:hypothetical protein